MITVDRLCGLVIRILGYSPRSPGFDSRCHQIFCVTVGLERGPLSLVRINEELRQGESRGCRIENRGQRPWGTVAVTTPLSANSRTSDGGSVDIFHVRT
jgi:hypothetical protein